MVQEVVNRALEPRAAQRLAGDIRYAGKVGLRLRTTVGILRQRGIGDPSQLVGDVRCRQQHLRSRAVHRALVQRQSDGNQRDKDDRLCDDPLAAARDTQVVTQRIRACLPGDGGGHLSLGPPGPVKAKSGIVPESGQGRNGHFSPLGRPPAIKWASFRRFSAGCGLFSNHEKWFSAAVTVVCRQTPRSLRWTLPARVTRLLRVS